MIRLSAFADEISPDLHEQLAVLNSEQIHFLDLRGVEGVNVLDLTDQQVAAIQQALAEQHIGVAAIGSPIGKVPIDAPFDEHLRRFERALELAHALGTPFVRIFSFYPPANAGSQNDPADWRDEVLHRLRELTTRAKAAHITLLHENEKDIYGDTIARCVDLLETINDPHFQFAFDPANFIQCRQVPYPDAYEALGPWLCYMHVKDARADGSVVAAGEGTTRWPELLQRLRDDGYDGFFSLEPHLAIAGQFQGFSGPALFRHASQSFQNLLRAMNWKYQ
ncbi:MAG TPA: sugar phosphate isomerase/epimerase family protein [Ktedonobacteraceae bacterium]|nr:sugar phosphate isomerase/epimerase family protein [Ktedonobacteraceae bacterium]